MSHPLQSQKQQQQPLLTSHKQQFHSNNDQNNQKLSPAYLVSNKFDEITSTNFHDTLPLTDNNKTLYDDNNHTKTIADVEVKLNKLQNHRIVPQDVDPNSLPQPPFPVGSQVDQGKITLIEFVGQGKP